ncbi:uncharacterized protein JCM10292_007071 [Rhodotorula paludigena]|uniref:uncharacterized protein n=1 Tax=Rhodotorula paludigena TaxID=86838 RepID=UPI00317F817A
MAHGLLASFVTGETLRILLSYQAFHSRAQLSLSLLACSVEATKLVVAAAALVAGGSIRQLDMHRAEDPLWRRALAYVGFFVPALLYLVNNVLYLVGLEMGPPALLQAFVMSKLPLTAVIHHFTMRPQTSPHAWIALGIIAVGLAETASSSVRGAFSGGAELSSLETLATPLLGLVIGLNTATANIWTEKMLKSDAPFWVAQFYLYLFGAMLASVLAMSWDGRVGAATAPEVALDDARRLTLIHYLLLVPLTAGVGLIVATILRQRDNLVKLVGSSTCIVTVFVAQACFHPALGRKTLNPHSVFGVGLIGIGTYAFNRFKDIPACKPAKPEYISLSLNEEAGHGNASSPDLDDVDEADFSATRVPAEPSWRQAWSPFFWPVGALLTITAVAALAGPLLGSASTLPSSHLDTAARLASRLPVDIVAVERFATSGGSEIKLDDMHWVSTTSLGTRTGRMRVATMRNLCVEPKRSKEEPVKYWLIGDTDVEKLETVDPSFEKSILRMFYHAGGPQHKFGVKDLASTRQTVIWINGTTFLYTKFEGRSHPASWMRVWANYVLLAANGYPLLEDVGVDALHFFDRHQLLEETFEPNSWAQFFANASIDAARAVLPGGSSGRDFYPQVDLGRQSAVPLALNNSAYAWHDMSDFPSAANPDLFCFEKSVKVEQDPLYFRDTHEADYFRRTVLSSLGYAPRSPPCRLADIQVVFLERNRLVYNWEDLVDVVNAAGVNLTMRKVDADVPYDEQVRMFQMADILFSVHGSHLNNQVFMEPTSTLIEMFPHLYYHDEQRRLASRTGVHHVELVDQPYPTADEAALYGGNKAAKDLEACLPFGREVNGDTQSCVAYHPCR